MAKSLLLLLLIGAAAAGGLVWFDYLNIIDMKTTLAPVFKLVGLQGRSQPVTEGDEMLNLDAERLAARLEALDLRSLELDKQEQAVLDKEAGLAQIASELEDRQKGLDERDTSITAIEEMSAIKDKNIERNARALGNMPPPNAVAIIASMDDQEAIDVLLKTEEIARSEGSASIVPFWLSLMQPQRAADLQRKMVERPN